MKLSINEKEKTILAYLIVLIVLTIAFIPYTRFGSTNIGSIIEKREYSEYYYINLFKDDLSNENIRLKAKINSSTPSFGDTGERTYYIEEIYLDDGNVIEFYNSGDFQSLEIGKKIWIPDDEDNDRYIELTKQKVSPN
ncbi:MAG: hypothetical protein K0S61_703 [Anaerocolumna sp.]|jgi:hypothetical protein|nr:hypothetical protein [Anaerocolumna sp.]